MKNIIVILTSLILFSGCTASYVSAKVIGKGKRVRDAKIYIQNNKDISKIPNFYLAETHTNIIGTFELRFSTWMDSGFSSERYLIIFKEGFKPYCKNVKAFNMINGGPWVGRFNTRILNTIYLEPDE